MRNPFNQYPLATRLTGLGIVASGALALGILRPWESPASTTVDIPAVASASPFLSKKPAETQEPQEPAFTYSPKSVPKPSASNPEAQRFLKAVETLPDEEQLDLMIGRVCTWIEADLPAWSRYGAVPHSEAVSDVRDAYTWKYAEANDLLTNINDGGGLPDYSMSGINQNCPQVILRPAG